MDSKTILVVEDNPVNMELATDLLEVGGFRVLQADNAEQGIDSAIREQPNLILMDIALPGMDGLTATTILTGDARTHRIPIVALTAHAMKGDEERAIGLGCVGYITKPLDTRRFVQAIEQFLVPRSSRGRLAA